MENIKIYNDFLSISEIKTIKKIINNNKWTFGHTSVNEFYTVPFWYMKLIDNDYLSHFMKSKIEELTNHKFEVTRLYANGQTYGQNGNFHQDDTNETSFTFVLYFSEFDSEIADIVGGNFEIKLPNINDYTVTISPLFNRGILFPSYYFHRGISFDRYVPDLRICIAWKLTQL